MVYKMYPRSESWNLLPKGDKESKENRFPEEKRKKKGDHVLVLNVPNGI